MSKIISGIFVVLTAMFFLLNGETKLINEETRKLAPHHSFSNGQHGITHYEDLGDPKNDAVILIHGVSGPMKVWDKIIPSMISKFRVIRFDLFGRGLSDRLKTDYNEELYETQLLELIQSLHVKEKVVLVGSSMGCIIASGFYNRHPELVKKLVLIGPAGFAINSNPLSKLMVFPFIGEYMMGTLGSSLLKTHHQKYFFQPENFPEMHEAYAEQLTYKGTKSAILSTMRHMPVQNYEGGFRKVGASNVPLLLIWGDKDVTFPFENHSKAQAYMPQAKFVVVNDAAHLPQYEKPETVISEILHFIP